LVFLQESSGYALCPSAALGYLSQRGEGSVALRSNATFPVPAPHLHCKHKPCDDFQWHARLICYFV